MVLSNIGVNLVRDGVSRKSLQRGAWGAFSPFEVTAFENLGERGGWLLKDGRGLKSVWMMIRTGCLAGVQGGEILYPVHP